MSRLVLVRNRALYVMAGMILLALGVITAVNISDMVSADDGDDKANPQAAGVGFPLVFQPGGVPTWSLAFNIFSDGANVGIGTLNPGATLDVNGNFRVANNQSIAGNSANEIGYLDIAKVGFGNELIIGHANNANLQFITGGTDGSVSMFIANGGNVGIGTLNPQSALEIANGPEMLRLDGTSGSYLGIGKGTDATSNSHIESIKGGSFRSALYLNSKEPTDVIIAQGGGNVGIGIHRHTGSQTPQAKLHVKLEGDDDTEVARFESNEGTKVVIDKDGNVGIGMTSPQSALEIASGLEQLRIDGTSGSYLRLGKGIDATSNAVIDSIKEGSFRSALYLNSKEPNDVIIAQGGGNVGIGFHPHVGSQAPQAKLHVKLHSDDDTEVARFESNEGTIVVVDKDGNVGIGTLNPQSALHINGYTQLDLTAGSPPQPTAMRLQRQGA